MNPTQQKRSTGEIVGRIKVNQSSETNHQNIQVNLRKRGNSANPTGGKIETPVNQKKKVINQVNSLITQVQKESKTNSQKNQIIQKNEKSTKSHSLSPNRLLNSMHLSLLPPKTSNKKTLVLDLDETLVHSGFFPFECPSDVIIKIELENEIHDIYVLVRPGVKKCPLGMKL